MARQPREIPSARIWSHQECAARLNKSVPWFYSHKRHLEQLGMPKKDRALGGWDAKAFEDWLDNRSGIYSHTNVESEMLGAIHGNN